MKKLFLILAATCFSLISFSQKQNEEIKTFEQNSYLNDSILIFKEQNYTFPDFDFTIPEFNFPEKTITIPNYNYEDISIVIPNIKIDEQHISIKIPDITIPEIIVPSIDFSEYEFPAAIFSNIGEEDNINDWNIKINNQSYNKKAAKDLKQTYKVNPNCKLEIENSFGKIEIIEWEKNEIEFYIQVEAKAKNEAKAFKVMESIDVNINHSTSGSRSIVKAKTKIPKNGINNASFTIDYVVKVPASVTMTLKNKFGDVYLGNVQNNLQLETSFGNVYINNLLGESNIINASFGTVEINDIAKTLNIDIEHGGKCKINSAEKLIANLTFTPLVLGDIDNLDIKIQHSSLKLNNIKDANIKAEFTDVKINSMENSLVCPKIHFGDLKVENINPNFSEINVNASFGNVRLALNETHSFVADLHTTFGSIKTGKLDTSKAVRYERISENNETVIRTTFGNNISTTQQVTVKNQHANIVLGK